MCFPGKKIVALTLVLFFVAQSVFCAPVVVSPVDRLNLNLTGDNRLYPLFKGIKLDLADPFKMEFVLDTPGNITPAKEEVAALIEYFLAALTMPQDDLWVNLSPDEPDRIISADLAMTHMGEIFLEQDYLLKQLSAGLTHPETSNGTAYWQGLSSNARAVNRVWIVSDGALVKEDGVSAYIDKMSLKAFVESKEPSFVKNILPLIQSDIEHARAFAPLRQVYSAFILAHWFKVKVRESIFKYHIDNKKLGGIDTADKQLKEKLYNQYLEAFTRGAYDYIQKTRNNNRRTIETRHYFSGGIRVDGTRVQFAPKNGSSASGPVAVVDFSGHSEDGGGYKRVSSRMMYDAKERGVNKDRYLQISMLSDHTDNRTPNGPIELFDKKIRLVTDSETPLPRFLHAYSFTDNITGDLIIVVKQYIYDDQTKLDEVIEHECVERQYANSSRVREFAHKMAEAAIGDHDCGRSDHNNALKATKKMFLQQVAHHLASERYIADHFDGENLSSIHQYDIDEMLPMVRGRLIKEDRYGYDEMRVIFFKSGEIAKIEAYERLFLANLKEKNKNVPIADPYHYNMPTDKSFGLDKDSFYLYNFRVLVMHLQKVNQIAMRLGGLDIEVVGLEDGRSKYILNYLRSHAGINKDLDQYLSVILGNLNSEFQDGLEYDLSRLTGEGVIRFLDKLGVLPEGYVAPNGSRNSNDNGEGGLLNYKRLGIDNQLVVDDAFKAVYVAYLLANGNKVQRRRWGQGYYNPEAYIIEELPGHPVPDRAPAVSFIDDKKRMITVMNSRLDRNIKRGDSISEYDEAIIHELLERVNFLSTRTILEQRYEQRGVEGIAARVAHFFATAELIKMHGHGRLLPLHRRDIEMMSVDTARCLLREDRTMQHEWLEKFMGRFLPIVKDYEQNIVQPALRARIDELSITNTQPIYSGSLSFNHRPNGGVQMNAKGIAVAGRSARFDLNPKILRELQEAKGMDFSIITIKPYIKEMK
jgi:uncharacterized protein YqgQ